MRPTSPARRGRSRAAARITTNPRRSSASATSPRSSSSSSGGCANVTIGDHRSLSHGSGFDFVGLRDWQAGDRFSTIDWAQSTLTNFSPLVVREFEQPSTASVVVVADASLSTRCGVNGVPIAAGDRPRHRHGRHVGGLLPGPVRPVHLRRVGPAPFRRAAAHRQEPGHSLPRRVSARARPAGSAADRQPEHDARLVHAQDGARAVRVGLPLRRRAQRARRAVAAQLHPRRVRRPRGRRVRLRAAARLGRVDRGVRRRERPLAPDVAPRPRAAWPAACAPGRTRWRRWPRTRISTSCASASTRPPATWRSPNSSPSDDSGRSDDDATSTGSDARTGCCSRHVGVAPALCLVTCASCLAVAPGAAASAGTGGGGRERRRRADRVLVADEHERGAGRRAIRARADVRGGRDAVHDRRARSVAARSGRAAGAAVRGGRRCAGGRPADADAPPLPVRVQAAVPRRADWR